MRIYNNIWTRILVLFVAYTSRAQLLPPATWTTTATPAITVKGKIVAELGFEASALGGAAALLDNLKKTDKEYDSRRKSTSILDPRTALLIGATLTSIEQTENTILDVQNDVAAIGISKVYFKHRLDEIDRELAIEKKYIDEIQDDYIWLGGVGVLGGGAGYTYTAFLKVLLRSMKIRRRVMVLKKEVDNLNTVNKIFIRK